MKQSKLFTKTTKDISADETSVNAQFLIRAGYVDKLTAGVYTFLPLGLRVLRKIENVVRKAMDEAGLQELLMPGMSPKENWDQTGRWDTFDVLYRFKGCDDKDYALNPTHEEVLTPLMHKFVRSYRDLPKAVYQIQTKFRNEKRAKAGLLRGREFLMKDAYSFHTNQADLDAYYNAMLDVYTSIYKNLGLGEITYVTYALGGSFSKYSHEFQTICENGEDVIFICQSCKMAHNKEVIETDGEICAKCGGKEFEQKKSIEVGNIFLLSDKFSKPFNFFVNSEEGKEIPVLMGCYGIGISRLVGTIVEVYNDANGIIWPKLVAPFQVHLVTLKPNDAVNAAAEGVYNDLQKAGIEVLFDDRDESVGVKLKDADLIGIPLRVIISEKSLANNQAEVKLRSSSESQMVELSSLIDFITQKA